MSILASYKKQREKKEEGKKKEDKLLTCDCGKKMQDYSYMRGSRKAGWYSCDCGRKIIF